MANNRLTNEWGEWEGEPPKGLLYQGNITGKGFGGETMRGAHPRAWQTDPSDTDWNMFGNPMQDRMAPDLSGENPNYIQDSRKYIGDERYDEEDPRELAAWYREMADKGLEIPQNAASRPDPEWDHYGDIFWGSQDDTLKEGRGPLVPWHEELENDPNKLGGSKSFATDWTPMDRGRRGEDLNDKLRRYAEEARAEDPEMMRRESYPNNRFGKYREE